MLPILRTLPHTLQSTECRGCVQTLAEEADGYSPADLEALLDRAVHAAAHRTFASGQAVTPGELDPGRNLQSVQERLPWHAID